jgi:GTP-binding protein LepA
MTEQSLIRNFSVIAHIDHGKSTLCDRILELTHAIPERKMREQVLDSMDLERERGITIKASAVRVTYAANDGQTYVFNIVDTPGHVDFTYEVSRSLAACEGAILVVDASQGVEAQTIANAHLAIVGDLEIIPVLNKIDLPNAHPERVTEEIVQIVGLPAEHILAVSAKQGIGVLELMEAIVQRIPPPQGDLNAPLRALIFDSKYDTYRGVITYVRIREGALRVGMPILLMSNGRRFEVQEVGFFHPDMRPVDQLSAGEVGYVIAGIKDVKDMRVGDTIAEADRPLTEPLPGYREPKPMVFCGLYPTDGEEFSALRDALEKLRLNDASLQFQPENSPALGFGFRCGFLGLLHMDIIQERLEREFGLSLIASAPSVVYRVITADGDTLEIDNPAKLPKPHEIETIEEPMVDATILAPEEYVGACLDLCKDRRGKYKDLMYAGSQRVTLRYELPLSEILIDFYDQLKSRTRGYASFDYELSGFVGADLVKVDILVNGEMVDALSFITHRERAYYRGKALVSKLKEVIPRQLFEVRLQAAIGSKVIASERIPPMRKDVLAKCYGGDITRKRKLLERQREGKKRMKQVGRVEIPQEAFLSVLKVNE